MKIPVGTVAPTLVLMAAIGWLLQSYLESPEGLNIPRPNTTEIAPSVLSPTLVERPPRNPFRLIGERDDPSSLALAAAFASVKSAGILAPSPTARGPTASPPEPAGRPSPSPTQLRAGLSARFRRMVQKLETLAALSARIRADLRSKVDDKVRLSATSIRGRRPIAILNGRAYAQGEAIDWATGIAGPIFLAEVRASSVVLRSGGAQVEVSFPSPSIATGPPPPAPATPTASRRPKNSTRAAGSGANRPR